MRPLRRLPGWRTRLATAIDEIRLRPFSWAGHDCACGLAARAVEAITGEDLAAPFRGRYDSPAGALQVMREAGHETLADLVASLLPEIPEGPCRARVGDIVTIPAEDAFGCALGVVTGERAFVLRPEGLATVELLQTHRAFRVGR